MATLLLEDGTILTDIVDIERKLATLRIKLNRWQIEENPQLQQLLQKEVLTDDEKEQVLQFLDRYFEQLQQTSEYQSRDLVVLYPNLPDIHALLAKFDKIHTHADDEVRFVIDGSGVFGFVLPDDSQVRLTVEPEEYINVPAGTEHWFYLTPANRIKAVRYFTGKEGWVPEYTGRDIRIVATV